MIMKILNRFPWKRVWQTLNIRIRLNARKRAAWLKKHEVFHSMGENVSLQFKTIPLYPRLISFGNNIVVASNVSFLTRDAIDQVINKANSIIYSNVRIGPNAIVAAGAVVTKDVPPGTVWGVPAKQIGTYDELVKKKLAQTESEERIVCISGHQISEELINRKWNNFKKGGDFNGSC